MSKKEGEASNYKYQKFATSPEQIELFTQQFKIKSNNFIEAQLGNKEREEWPNILFSAIKDLGAGHDIVKAFETYMLGQGFEQEKLEAIKRAGEGKEAINPGVVIGEASAGTLQAGVIRSPEKGIIVEHGAGAKPERGTLKNPRVEIQRRVTPSLQVAVEQGVMEAEPALQAKLRKAGEKPKAVPTPFSTVQGESIVYSPHSQQPKQAKVVDLEDEQDLVVEIVNNQPAGLAQDSIVFGGAGGDKPQTLEAEGIDAITQAIREEILQKQYNAIKEAVINAATDPGEKDRLASLDLQKFREYLTSEQGKPETSKILGTPELQKKLSEIEVAGYRKVHEQFKESFKPLQWETGDRSPVRSSQIKNEAGEVLANIKEITHATSPKSIALADGTTKTVSSYRTIDFPQKLESGKGPLHLSMAVKDENGKNIPEKDAVYFTAHYDKTGKLSEVSSPMPVKFAGDGPDAVGYIERNGKIYTLPVTKNKYQEMMREVAVNKEQEVGLSPKPKSLDVERPVPTPEPPTAQKEEARSHVPQQNPTSTRIILTGDPKKDSHQIDERLTGKTPEETVAILKEQVKMGAIEATKLIVEATRPDRQDRPAGVPQLDEEHYRKVYNYGMEEAANARHASLQRIQHQACGSLVKETRITPASHAVRVQNNTQKLVQHPGRGR